MVFGIGFLGSGEYKSRKKGVVTKAYRTWHSMLNRCYNLKFHKRNPTYIGCTVAKEWHNFQNFAQWFEDNYIEGYQIDKDIQIEGNKVYSPVNCMFVSRFENNEKASAKYYKMVSPSGTDHNIYNLTAFCRENNLDQGAMCNVNLGNLKSYKGWRKA